MPLLATALTAGKAAFSLIPKNKEARKKAAEKLKSGFQTFFPISFDSNLQLLTNDIGVTSINSPTNSSPKF